MGNTTKRYDREMDCANQFKNMWLLMYVIILKYKLGELASEIYPLNEYLQKYINRQYEFKKSSEKKTFCC